MFFCSLCTLLVAVLLLNEKLSILFACTVEYVKNGISTSVVVRFLLYMLEKQTVKAKKSTEVSASAKRELSGVLSARCIYVIGHGFPAEHKFG